jgi:saccharopine dehydrogenase-like NADP-dependent oxidoreductase
MKTILLFGAGKSATVLIDYLLENSIIENWKIVVVDADLKLAQTKIGGAQRAMAISFDINDTAERNKHIRHSDIVISLLPPDLHIRVAESCIEAKKNLLLR